MKAPPSNVTSLNSTLVLEGEITTRASISQALATIFLPSSRTQMLKMITRIGQPHEALKLERKSFFEDNQLARRLSQD